MRERSRSDPHTGRECRSPSNSSIRIPEMQETRSRVHMHCTLHGALCAGARTQWNRCTQACYMDFLSQQMLGLKVHLHIVNNLTGLATCGEV